MKIIQCLEVRKDKNTTSIKKSNCLTTVMKDNVISSLPPGRYLNALAGNGWTVDVIAHLLKALSVGKI